MKRHVLALVLLLLTAFSQPALAQIRPGAFSTLFTSDTTATSVCVGANNLNTPTTCTGGVKAGPAIFDTSTLVVDATSDRVGIGTASPTAQFHISGSEAVKRMTSTGGGVSWDFISNNASQLVIREVADSLPSLTISDTTGAFQFQTSGNATRTMDVANGTSGTTAAMDIRAINNSSNYTYIRENSSAFTPVGINLANGGAIGSTGAGGLSITADGANAVLRFYTNSATHRWTIDANGHLVPAVDQTHDIGSTALQVRKIFMTSGVSGGVAWGSNLSLSANTVATPNTYQFNLSTNAQQTFHTTNASAAGAAITIHGTGVGTGNVIGPALTIQQNSSGNGSAGHIGMYRRGGTPDYIWPDNSGLLRISTAPPQEDGTPSDTSGTVVGDQTSSLASKIIHSTFTNNINALNTILATPVYNFSYRSGAYNLETFTGIVTDESPAFGKDGGKSFNEVSAFGYTVAAIKALKEEIDALRREIAILKAAKQ